MQRQEATKAALVFTTELATSKWAPRSSGGIETQQEQNSLAQAKKQLWVRASRCCHAAIIPAAVCSNAHSQSETWGF